MKRFLPFLIIGLVAIVTIVSGTLLYRAKMRTASTRPAPAAGPSASTPAGTEPDAHARGPKDAPVTLEIYGDFQCPACANASTAVDELAKDYGEKLRVIFRQFPLAMHNHALEAAMAAEAAGMQGHFWQMHDALYKYQHVWTRGSHPEPFFNAYASSMGLNMQRFAADSHSEDVKAKIQAEAEAGVTRGVQNTPTIYVNGAEVRGFTHEQLKEAIDSALAGKKA